MTDRKAVIKNADMSEDMQQDAVDCATQAIEKYNIEKVCKNLNNSILIQNIDLLNSQYKKVEVFCDRYWLFKLLFTYFTVTFKFYAVMFFLAKNIHKN